MIATGKRPSELWVLVNNEWQLLQLPAYSVLFFRGDFMHCGADFWDDNAVLHAYIGNQAMIDAHRKHGFDLFDTTNHKPREDLEDPGNPNAAFQSSQQTLSQTATGNSALQATVRRAKETQQQASEMAARPAPQTRQLKLCETAPGNVVLQEVVRRAGETQQKAAEQTQSLQGESPEQQP